ncbi:hypothetical protein CLV98_10580 [Dyadobacter jejuensis]|uniref:Uncharacterized protein n=1 Tax=Dyadobacter jejuensis TaxID=1082580 RepID=A0A316AM81_9BACT|nr:hypothetical protein CLV98_10580 [Dyadobacter jejuensis]
MYSYYTLKLKNLLLPIFTKKPPPPYYGNVTVNAKSKLKPKLDTLKINNFGKILLLHAMHKGPSRLDLLGAYFL